LPSLPVLGGKIQFLVCKYETPERKTFRVKNESYPLASALFDLGNDLVFYQNRFAGFTANQFRRSAFPVSFADSLPDYILQKNSFAARVADVETADAEGRSAIFL